MIRLSWWKENAPLNKNVTLQCYLYTTEMQVTLALGCLAVIWRGSTFPLGMIKWPIQTIFNSTHIETKVTVMQTPNSLQLTLKREKWNRTVIHNDVRGISSLWKISCNCLKRHWKLKYFTSEVNYQFSIF